MPILTRCLSGRISSHKVFRLELPMIQSHHRLCTGNEVSGHLVRRMARNDIPNGRSREIDLTLNNDSDIMIEAG